MTERQPFTALVYGEPGVGKTPVALSVPGPVLVLDVEGGSRYVQRPRVTWNARTEQPPADDGSWELCVVNVADWATVQAVAGYLRSGRHPFTSVVLDSVTELQKKCHRNIVANSRGDRATEQTWGFLLTDMEDTLRDLRDSTMHPENPTTHVVFTARAVESKGGVTRPDVQGALSRSLPGMVDVVGYLYADDDENGEPSAQPEARRLLVAPTRGFVAKDRTSSLLNGGVSALYGATVEGPLDLSGITERIYEES